MSPIAINPAAAADPWRAEVRACLALATPLVATNAIETALGLTNTVMIGRIAPNALAASSLAIALYMVALVFGIGLTAAVSALVARERGRSDADPSAIRRLVQGGLWNAVAVTVPISVVLWEGGPILRAAGQDPALIPDAVAYLHALQGALLPALVYLVLRAFLTALQRPRAAVLAGALGVVLNAALNWLLIGGHGGLPALGLVGSGLATLLSNLAMALALGLATVVDPDLRRYRIFAGLVRPPWAPCGALWRLGLPIGIAIVLEVGLFTVATGVVGRIDSAALPAHAIALQVASLTFMIPLGIAQAATVRVGSAAGAGDPRAVGRAGWVALAIAVGVMAASAAVLVAFPGPIVGLFIAPGEAGADGIFRGAAVLLAIAGLFQIADGAQVVLAGMLRGLEDTRVPMIVAAVGYWGVGFPLASGLAQRFAAPGVWIGLTAGLFAVAGLLLLRWLSWCRALQPALAL